MSHPYISLHTLIKSGAQVFKRSRKSSLEERPEDVMSYTN